MSLFVWAGRKLSSFAYGSIEEGWLSRSGHSCPVLTRSICDEHIQTKKVNILERWFRIGFSHGINWLNPVEGSQPILQYLIIWSQSPLGHGRKKIPGSKSVIEAWCWSMRGECWPCCEFTCICKVSNDTLLNWNFKKRFIFNTIKRSQCSYTTTSETVTILIWRCTSHGFKNFPGPSSWPDRLTSPYSLWAM